MNLLDVFHSPLQRVPCWFMRQAGRYLPEYLDLRKKEPDFIKFCLSPHFIREATLQPIKRYDLDAAIVFSDILMIPYALGQKVWFEPHQGPFLEEYREDFAWERGFENLTPIYEGIDDIRKQLDPDLALIGFAGGPYTLACYMLEGKGSKMFSKAHLYGFQYPEKMEKLLDRLADKVILHLQNQIKAGCNVLQIFESWAGNVPDSYVGPWLVRPVKKIVEALKDSCPDVPLIIFAKNLGGWIPDYVQQVQPNGISLSSSEKLTSLLPHLPSDIVFQGALDPYLLAVGGEIMKKEIDRQLELFKDRRYIFNLGHGIVPETPPENVEEAIKQVRKFS